MPFFNSKIILSLTAITIIAGSIFVGFQNQNKPIVIGQNNTFGNIVNSFIPNSFMENTDIDLSPKPQSRQSSVINSSSQIASSVVIEKSKINPDPIKVSDQKIAPLINNIKTNKPVIFLGIDDGLEQKPEVLKFFQDRKWSFTLFPNKIHYDKNPEYFKSILATGAVLGNHTINHPNLNKLSYDQQKKEICAAQEAYKKDFGTTPKLFRPPFGNYNKNTQQAVKDCGMKAMVNWKARVDEGKMWYQVGDKLNKGEIVLMHFRPKMMEDLKAFEEEINKQGLQVGNLDEWIE